MISKHAAIYIRVATEESAQNGRLAAQEQCARQWAEQNGYLVTHVYTDIGSGNSDQRPGLQQLLADAKTGWFSALILRDITRLYRKLAVTQDCLHLLNHELGLEIVLIHPLLVWKRGEAGTGGHHG